MRPVFGANREGVAVVANGKELLYHRPLSPTTLPRALPRGRWLRRPRAVLLEERISSPGAPDALPLEYKVHVFGAHVAVIERLARTGAHETKHRYYRPDWEAVDDEINTYVRRDPDLHEPPSWLDDMLGRAAAMGEELGTFMRIDFFAGEEGPVFNEFSSMPLAGQKYTPVAQEAFGSLWAEHCPDGV
jgi:hypothetical protein